MKKKLSTNNEQRTTKFVFSKESLKKQFRWSEFLSEKIITAVAFMSIAIIALIFIFVFRETLPIFRSSKSKQQTAISKQQTKNERPEVYGAESSEQRPEVYGADSNQSKVDSSQSSSIESGRQTSMSSKMSGGEGEASARGLLKKTWQPVSDNPRYGLLSLLIGTLKITFIAMFFAAPIGIFAALYSVAFSPKWMKEIIKPVVEILAGFPSVVIGFFALMVMASFFQNVFGYATRLNAFVGGVALAIAAIPIIFTISEDALNAVPKSYRDASLALGANKWQTALFVTLPAATPGIFASILLGTGRVFGETMIVLMATGNAALSNLNPFDSVRTFSATIGAEMAEVVFGDTHYNVLFLIGSLLFIFTFTLNAIAEFYIKGILLKRLQGKT